MTGKDGQIMQNKISLAGDLGSGKSTVSAILIEKLNAQYYSTGAIVREIAQRHGMSVVELNRYMETHPEIDHEIDDGLVALSTDPRMLIIDSRMAWHFTSGTFTVYLSTDPVVAAQRIMSANRSGEHAETLEDTVAQTRARRVSERKRYMEQYGVNIQDMGHYACVLDTTYATPAEVADRLLSAFAAWQADGRYRTVQICPKRLVLPDGVPDADAVVAKESDGVFTVLSGANLVRDALAAGATHLALTLA